MITPIYIVAFTGHRPAENLPGRSQHALEECRPLIHDALRRFQQQAAQVDGCIHLLSSVAQGADIIACEVAEEMGIPVHIILPLNLAAFEATFKTDHASWERAMSCIQRAQDPHQPGSFRIAPTSHQHPDCYAETNHQMLRSADALLAVWNGEESRGVGGIHEFWKSAVAHGLPRIQINPASQTLNSTSLGALTEINDHHDPLSTINEALSQLTPTTSHSSSDDLLEQLTPALKQAANTAGNKIRNTQLLTILLHGAASLLAAAGISYALIHADTLNQILPVLLTVSIIEFILIAIAHTLHTRHHHAGKDWVYLRFARELIRPLRQLYPHHDPLLPQIQFLHPEWRRFYLSITLASPPNTMPSLNEAKQRYINERLQPQIDYFKEKGKQADRSNKKILASSHALSLFALFVVAIACWVKYQSIQHPHGDEHSFSSQLAHFALYFLPIALPLISGILLALRHSRDVSRRANRYHQMHQFLSQAKLNIEAAETQHSFKLAITETEKTLQQELSEFLLSQSNALQ